MNRSVVSRGRYCVAGAVEQLLQKEGRCSPESREDGFFYGEDPHSMLTATFLTFLLCCGNSIIILATSILLLVLQC